MLHVSGNQLTFDRQMFSCIGEYVLRKFQQIPEDADLDSFLKLLVQVAQHQSLMVSIPVLLTWAKLLAHKPLDPGERFSAMMGPLLELSISRFIRYEQLPEDTNDPSYLFLAEDTDTVPERHAFLGNYRRYASTIVEIIVQYKLFDAVTHILGNTEVVLQHLYDGGQGLDSRSNYPECILSALVFLTPTRKELFQVFHACSESRCKLRSHRSHAARVHQVAIFSP